MRDGAKGFSAVLKSVDADWRHVQVRRVSGRESISELFRFDIEVTCDPDHDLPERFGLGSELSLLLEVDGEEVRSIHGIACPILNRLDATAQRRSYKLGLVPRATQLGLLETQQIFQDLTVPEIIAQKLSDHGYGPEDFELRLLESYPRREFIVQLHESHLSFIRRLAEHHGISFFFEHEHGRDKIVFTDVGGGFGEIDGAFQLPFRPRGEALGVFELGVEEDLVPTTFVVQDYNHRTPRVDLTALFPPDGQVAGGVIEYGSHVKTPEESLQLARIRYEEAHSRQRVYSGKSSEITLSAGRRIELMDHPRLAPVEALLPLEVVHDMTLPVFEGGESAHYHNSFRALSTVSTYRPPRRTPKPRVDGVVTGVVQPGPQGQTNGTAVLDSEGRYTVSFHFDFAAPGQSKSSRPVRVAQPFGGMGHGMHFPLRPGTEVAVAFVNGDPDRPIIVGAIYNAESPSPVAARNPSVNRITTASGSLFEISEKR